MDGWRRLRSAIASTERALLGVACLGVLLTTGARLWAFWLAGRDELDWVVLSIVGSPHIVWDQAPFVRVWSAWAPVAAWVALVGLARPSAGNRSADKSRANFARICLTISLLYVPSGLRDAGAYLAGIALLMALGFGRRGRLPSWRVVMGAWIIFTLGDEWIWSTTCSSVKGMMCWTPPPWSWERTIPRTLRTLAVVATLWPTASTETRERFGRQSVAFLALSLATDAVLQDAIAAAFQVRWRNAAVFIGGIGKAHAAVHVIAIAALTLLIARRSVRNTSGLHRGILGALGVLLLALALGSPRSDPSVASTRIAWAASRPSAFAGSEGSSPFIERHPSGRAIAIVPGGVLRDAATGRPLSTDDVGRYPLALAPAQMTIRDLIIALEPWLNDEQCARIRLARFDTRRVHAAARFPDHYPLRGALSRAIEYLPITITRRCWRRDGEAVPSTLSELNERISLAEVMYFGESRTLVLEATNALPSERESFSLSEANEIARMWCHALRASLELWLTGTLFGLVLAIATFAFEVRALRHRPPGARAVRGPSPAPVRPPWGDPAAAEWEFRRGTVFRDLVEVRWLSPERAGTQLWSAMPGALINLGLLVGPCVVVYAALRGIEYLQ